MRWPTDRLLANRVAWHTEVVLMSKRVWTFAGACLVLAVGMLIGQSASHQQNDEERQLRERNDRVWLENQRHQQRSLGDSAAIASPPKRRVQYADMDTSIPARSASQRKTRSNAVWDAAPAESPMVVDANPFAQAPGQLPPQKNASPIPGSAQIRRPQELQKPTAGIRDVIKRELPNASETEIDALVKNLGQQSPRDVKMILEMRRRFGSLIPNRSPDAFEPEPFEPEPTRHTPTIEPPQHVGRRPTVPGFHRDVMPPVHDFSPPTPIVINAPDIPKQLQPTYRSLHLAQKILLNNIANANTPGFKRSRVHFVDLPSQRSPSSGAMIGQGSCIAPTVRDWGNGPLRQTDGQLDITIIGKGFFQIQGGSKLLYTRCGRFTVNADRDLVFAVAGKNYLIDPPISFPTGTTRIDIGDDGNVSATAPPAATVAVAQLLIASFANPDGLTPVGNTLFAVSEESGPRIEGPPGQEGRGKLKQGFLETSNVDLKRELGRLRTITQQIQAIEQAAGLVKRAPILSLPSQPQSVTLPPLDQPLYRSMMNDLKRRAQRQSAIKTSSHAPARATKPYRLGGWSRVSEEAREIKRNLGIDLGVDE